MIRRLRRGRALAAAFLPDEVVVGKPAQQLGGDIRLGLGVGGRDEVAAAALARGGDRRGVVAEDDRAGAPGDFHDLGQGLGVIHCPQVMGRRAENRQLQFGWRSPVNGPSPNSPNRAVPFILSPSIVPAYSTVSDWPLPLTVKDIFKS